jgi:hypothetical protein
MISRIFMGVFRPYALHGVDGRPPLRRYRTMSGKPMKLIVHDHQNGKSEVVGFFCVRKAGKPYLEKPLNPDAPSPIRFNSYQDAKAFVEKKTKVPLTFAAVSFSPFQQPIVWIASPEGSKGDTFDISYVGSFRYFSGNLVDTMVVGTENENVGGVVN